MQSVRSFYSFTPLTANQERCQRLLLACQQLRLLGTIRLAAEGINGSLCGTPSALDSIFSLLGADDELGVLSYRTTAVNPALAPFCKLTVQLSSTILNRPTHPELVAVKPVEPANWDELIGRPDVQLVDLRNCYESRIGAFSGAHLAAIDQFCDFPDYARQHLNPSSGDQVAVYCTGGIRCEKAGSWLKEQGFSQCYQLSGGILNYLASAGESEDKSTSLWQGDCFVFDRRMAVKSDLTPVDYGFCRHCQMPLKTSERGIHTCGISSTEAVG